MYNCQIVSIHLEGLLMYALCSVADTIHCYTDPDPFCDVLRFFLCIYGKKKNTNNIRFCNMSFF